LVAIALVFSRQSAHGGSVLFQTPTNSTTGGGPVNATALFTTNGSSLQIVLTNNTLNTGNVAQVLTGIRFIVNGSTTSGNTLNSATGYIAEIVANKTYSNAQLGSIAPHWALTNPQNTFNLNTVPGTGGQPDDGIIGPGASGSNMSSGSFPLANESIVTNNPHNPFVLTTGTFNLTISGSFNQTNITGVVFQFGTLAGQNTVPGEPGDEIIQEVPEPASLSLAGIGLVGFAGYVYRRRRQKAAA
jgi:hypothetical protein